MAGKIILIFCCFLCAVPFICLGIFGRKSKDPLSFWSGDNSLKSKVADVSNYNNEMGRMYLVYGCLWLFAALVGIFNEIIAVLIIIIGCTLGIWLMYKKYKQILGKYGKE